MSSIDAANAASTRTPAQVIHRETVANGFIVSVSIPKGVTTGSYPTGDERIPFFHFVRLVPGGAVHLFLHSQDRTLIGRRNVTAEATIMRKHYADGSTMLYVDLVPTDCEPTHGVAVMKFEAGSWTGAGWPVFRTASPLNGIVIIHPLGAKLIPGAEFAVQMTPAFKPSGKARRRPPARTTPVNTAIADAFQALGMQIA